MNCAAPTIHAFDIDIYDCPCSHMYGDHEYHYEGNRMIIAFCRMCRDGARWLTDDPAYMERWP